MSFFLMRIPTAVALGVAGIELAIVLFACCLGKRYRPLDHMYETILKTHLLAHIVSKNLDILRSITHPATRIIMIKNKVMRVKHYCIA